MPSGLSPRPTPPPVTFGTVATVAAAAAGATIVAVPAGSTTTDAETMGTSRGQETTTVAMPAASHVIENGPPLDGTSAPKSTYAMSGRVASVPGVPS